MEVASGTIEVVPKNHRINWDWCQFCAGDLDGVEPAEQPVAEGKKLSTKLKEADSLEEIQESQDQK